MGYENPLLSLPSVRKVLALPREQRRALEALMRDLRAEADNLAEVSWRRRKGPLATYWRAVSTYARHVAHALSKGDAQLERPAPEATQAAPATAPTPAAVVDHDRLCQAVHAAAVTLYFDDNSEYERALWGVLRALAPEVHQALENGQGRTLFDADMNLLWEPGKGLTGQAEQDSGAEARRERER